MNKSKYVWFPIVNCRPFDEFESELEGIIFCALRKIIVVTSFVLILAFSYQLVVQGRYYQKTEKSLLQLWIMRLCLISQISVFVHYSVYNSVLRSELFSLIELYRFTIFYLTCLYYTNKAQGLLKNRKCKQNVLHSISVSGITFMTISGLTIAILIWRFDNGNTEYGINPRNLC
jgi:hypothetical protein